MSIVKWTPLLIGALVGAGLAWFRTQKMGGGANQ